MQITELRREDEKAWDSYVLKSSTSTFYHQLRSVLINFFHGIYTITQRSLRINYYLHPSIDITGASGYLHPRNIPHPISPLSCY